MLEGEKYAFKYKLKDEIIMRLVHYFVTGLSTIIVNGVKNEIWLENLDAPYQLLELIQIISII